MEFSIARPSPTLPLVKRTPIDCRSGVATMRRGWSCIFEAYAAFVQKNEIAAVASIPSVGPLTSSAHLIHQRERDDLGHGLFIVPWLYDSHQPSIY